MRELTVGSLFTGLGFFDLGFVAAGCSIAFQCEINSYCQEYLTHGHARQYWPAAHLIPDATDPGYDWGQWRGTDILIGGFPCQPFSIAGKRKGANDHRNMWPHFARIIGLVRPRAVVLENVSSITAPYRGTRIMPERGKYSATRIRVAKTRKRPPYAAKVIHDLSQMGYVCAWGIVSAADAGATHNRARWWCVAYADGSGYAGSPAGNGTSDENRDDSAHQPSGANIADAAQSGGEAVADSRLMGSPESRHGRKKSSALRHRRHASGRHQKMADAPIERSKKRHIGKSQAPHTQSRKRMDGRSQRCRFDGFTIIRPAQSRLGGHTNGLARWLEFPRWPAPQGEYQHHYEPPRTTTEKQDRAERIEALGNSLIPQIAFALAREVTTELSQEN